MSTAIKSDLLLKDELDPIDSASSTLLVDGLKAEASFKGNESNGDDCIKDEFTDEMEDGYCETNTDDGGGSGDQDTETDELNDAEEINDEMTVMEEDVEMVPHTVLQHEEEEDPLNVPLLGDHHLLHTDHDMNGEEEEEVDDADDDDLGEEETATPATAELNGDDNSHVDDVDISDKSSTPDSGGSRQRAGGLKRKAGESEVEEDKQTAAGSGVASVRKSSRIRILLDLRKEKEEAMLQGKHFSCTIIVRQRSSSIQILENRVDIGRSKEEEFLVVPGLIFSFMPIFRPSRHVIVSQWYVSLKV